VRERGYEAQLTAAYPVHPELFRILQTDWSALANFQKTRGLLKMMAQIVYRLWRNGHSAPMILPGDVPLTDDKVRTNISAPPPHFLPQWSLMIFSRIVAFAIRKQ
jgi:predicted AAA+ superfamily ATPase